LGVQQALLPRHTSSAFGQLPQLSVPPHPSEKLPHWPALHVFGTQQVPLMQDSLFGQVDGQLIVPPHPSDTVPQSLAPHVVFFVQHALFKQT
jgi:hypothetical protein